MQFGIGPHIMDCMKLCRRRRRLRNGWLRMYEITKQTLIGDIMDHAPEVAPLFYSIGMYCLSCDSSRGETLEEACVVHEVDADSFLEQVHAWQQTCAEDPEAAAQNAALYSMFGMGDLYGLDGDYGWSSIEEELAAFGIDGSFSGFSSDFEDGYGGWHADIGEGDPDASPAGGV